MILAFESSCDDTALALMQIDSGKLIWHKKLSQEAEHAKWGGVVPELAARLHAQALPKLLEEVKPYFSELKAICATVGPGLGVTLVEGLVTAKLTAVSLGLPFIGVDHLSGHIHSLFIGNKCRFPLHILLVSGGHTLVLEAKNSFDVTLLASTMDDSLGESFDKCAKMLGLGYPGGPIVEELALKGEVGRFVFPVPLRHTPQKAFSYSGLKNAVRVAISEQTMLDEQTKADICCGFQIAAVAHLTDRLKKIFTEVKPTCLGIVGGASANKTVRLELEKLCKSWECEVITAPLEYCSDNAAMIARVGIEHYKQEQFANPLTLLPYTRSPWF